MSDLQCDKVYLLSLGILREAWIRPELAVKVRLERDNSGGRRKKCQFKTAVNTMYGNYGNAQRTQYDDRFYTPSTAMGFCGDCRRK
eukprot:scaffold10347_cov96-Skeletonema_marinoi.AAC.2